jgi:NTP pyrophosphatase (non-canonical NTP hydrolase)
MTYYLYHIIGKKIGVTRDLKYRVEEQQGYNEDEYDVLMETDDILQVSNMEILMQKAFGYRVDDVPYNKLKFNNTDMNINITEQTTTFPCPVNKLKGQLMDNIGMEWKTDHGDCIITSESVDWIMKNVQTSKYNDQRCYVYNKAFARYFDNNDPYSGKTRTGGIMTDCRENGINMPKSHFDLIRKWASNRGLYKDGDPKTQALKLVEEVGETCKAILKSDQAEIEDGIGDCVVVLTNLAHLCNTDIEHCIELAYNEIKDRKGKMDNGTFKKD